MLERGLLVRRINIRQALALLSSRLWPLARRMHANLRRHGRHFCQFKRLVGEFFDREMLRRAVLRGTVLREVYTEVHYHGGTHARQVGSYPLLVYIPARVGRFIDVVVVDHGSRSALALPPVNLNAAGKRVLRCLSGMSRERLDAVLGAFKSLDEVRARVGGGEFIKYVSV